MASCDGGVVYPQARTHKDIGDMNAYACMHAESKYTRNFVHTRQ